jgi:hypothetical protein
LHEISKENVEKDIHLCDELKQNMTKRKAMLYFVSLLWDGKFIHSIYYMLGLIQSDSDR